MMNLDGSGVTRVMADIHADVHPRFAPDGAKIVFQSTRDSTWDIYTMNLDGTGICNITRTPAHDGHPDWR